MGDTGPRADAQFKDDGTCDRPVQQGTPRDPNEHDWKVGKGESHGGRFRKFDMFQNIGTSFHRIIVLFLRDKF